jgi:N6-adenosine-specific RNA methylase IME4
MVRKYQIIYADPPWSYNDKMKGHSFSLDHEYKTQDKNWIWNLPIQNISDKDCVLFLWVVNPMLPEGIETIKRWGFKFKTVPFVWVKQTINKKWVSNLGRWTMGGAEICLLGVKGKPKRIIKNVKQLVFAERKRHSEKPAEIRDRIVTLMGDLPRIELFARQKTPGWDAWGNEVESDIELK